MLMWDIIFMDKPGAFETDFQSCPLDMFEDSFYFAREAEIEARVEEIKNGKPPFSAMEAGFSKAWSTIIDSNLTTLIKMAILYAFGAGVVRGFAVTIFLGILISMFTATLLVRLMMTTWILGRTSLHSKTLMQMSRRLTSAPLMESFHTH